MSNYKEIDVSQLFFKIEKIREIYDILWGKNKEKIARLDETVYCTISYALLYAFLDNLYEIFAPKKSWSSGTTLYKLMKFMEGHKESQSDKIAEGIELMIADYEGNIRGIVESRLKPLRHKLLVHLDKNSNEELVKEMKSLSDNTIDYSYPLMLLEYAESVVKFTRIMEKGAN